MTDLGKTRPFPSKNLGIKYLLCVVDVFVKYMWVKLLKEKLAETALNRLQLDSNLEPLSSQTNTPGNYEVWIHSETLT